MDKNSIISVLNDWNFWRNDLDSGIPREDYLKNLNNLLSTTQVIVITGPRRAGKSFLMRQLAKDLIARGINKNTILMINFEDPRLGELDAKILQKIYETYLEFLSPQGTPYVFLDEIQEVTGWEKWVRMMHELGKAKLIISGSNAKLLSQELSTLLTGRYVNLTVFPLSFKERLSFNGIRVQDILDTVSKRIEINTVLRDYVENGSFPNVVLSTEKKQILLNYFEDVINKDLIRRFKIRKPEQMKSLARFYLSNVSCPVTFSSIEKFLNISADTIEKFSGYFEDAYLFYFVKRFSFKLKEQEKSPRKVYAVDTGLANAVSFRMSQDIGRMSELLVFLQLARKQANNPNMGVFYWKDAQHGEVDFVIKESEEIKDLIQVCWDISNVKTKTREIKSLVKAMDEFGLDTSYVITEEHEAEERINNKAIHYVPLWKWLL